jgi:DNA-binding phage protein
MSDVIGQALIRVRAFIAEQGLTLKDVGERARPQLAYTTVRDALKEGANPRIETLSAILAIVPDDFEPKAEAEDEVVQ